MDEYIYKSNIIKTELDKNPMYKGISSLDKSLICMRCIICNINPFKVNLLTVLQGV